MNYSIEPVSGRRISHVVLSNKEDNKEWSKCTTKFESNIRRFDLERKNILPEVFFPYEPS